MNQGTESTEQNRTTDNQGAMEGIPYIVEEPMETPAPCGDGCIVTEPLSKVSIDEAAYGGENQPTDGSDNKQNQTIAISSCDGGQPNLSGIEKPTSHLHFAGKQSAGSGGHGPVIPNKCKFSASY